MSAPPVNAPEGTWSSPGSCFDLSISWSARQLTPAVADIELTLTERSAPSNPQLAAAQPQSVTYIFSLGISSPGLQPRAQFVFLGVHIYVFLSPQVATDLALLGLEFPLTEASFFRDAVARWSLFPQDEEAPDEEEEDEDEEDEADEEIEALVEEAQGAEPPASKPRARKTVKKSKPHKRRS